MAQVAQTYSEKCVYAHNPSRASQAPSFSTVGENLALTTSSVDDYTGLFQAWYNQRNNYNFNTNNCSKPNMCGHYTQVKCISV